jgi:hypothetical protein
MLWYVIEPLVGAELLGKARHQRVQEFIARRMATTARRGE